MKFRYLFILLGMGCVGWAHAEIYKYIDSKGHITYSSTPIKGAKKLDLGALPTMAPYKESAADFPRVDQALQRNRDEERRKILENELSAEEKLLAEAQQNLKDAEDNPQVSHVDGKTYRNVVAYEESVKAAQEQVTLHQRNVDALKAELSRFK